MDFSYDVRNARLPKGTNVALYWSADDKFDPGTDTPTGYSIAAQRAIGSYGPFHVDALTLGTPPQGATHLLVVADPSSLSNPFGEVPETDEGNNVKALQLGRPGLAAVGVEYIPGATIADDLLKVDYSASRLDPSGARPIVDVYWSRTPEFTDRISSAYRFDADTSDGTHTKWIPVKDLAARPGGGVAGYLLLHVDSAGGTKYAGDIQEEDEDDNLLEYRIRHDVKVTSAAFNPQIGGLDVAYEVADRAWIPGKIPVDLFWGANRRASTATLADPALRGLHVAANHFVPPSIQEYGVRVVFDAQDDDPGNDQAFAALIGLAPRIDLATIGTPTRKHGYDVVVTVTNNAPVPMAYRIGFREDAPATILVRDTASLSDRLDAGSGTVPAARYSDGVEVLLAYGASDTRSLGSLDGAGAFNRTWNWIPSFKFYQDILLQLAGLNASAAGGQVVDLVLARLRIATGGVGAELARQAVSQLAGTILPQSDDTIDKAPIDYRVKVTTLAASGVDTVEVSTVALDVQPLQRTAFNNFQVLFDLTLQEMQAAISAADQAANSKNLATQASAAAALALASAQYIHNAKALANLYRAALDPPDPNYATVAVPTPTFAIPAGLDSSTPWWNVARILVEFSGLESAILTTIDRIQGAVEAGDHASEAAQRLALSEFSGRAGLLHGDLIAAESRAYAAILRIPIDRYATLRAEIAAGRLPARLATALRAAGADAAVLGIFAGLIARAPALTADVPGGVAAMRALRAELLSGTAINELLRGVAIRTTIIGQPVLAVPEEQSRDLASRREAIASLLNSGADSDRLRTLIVDFVALVRGLIDQTNNVEALGPDLEYGYGATAQWQALAIKSAIARPPVPALVVPVSFNVLGGKPRRPAADSITIAFNGAASIGGEAFRLVRKQGRRWVTVRLVVATSVEKGRTVTILRTTGRRQPFLDGMYTLTIRGNKIVDGLGRPMDGNGDSVAGGDRVEVLRIVRGRRK